MEEKLMAIEKFIESIPVGPLAIVALSGSKALGETVDAYISDWRSERIEAKESPITFKGYVKDSYLLDVDTPRFGTGEAKCTLRDTVRGTDLYIIDDVTNYSVDTLFVVTRTICHLMTTMLTLSVLLLPLPVKQRRLQLLCLSYMKADSIDVLLENLWTVQ